MVNRILHKCTALAVCIAAAVSCKTLYGDETVPGSVDPGKYALYDHYVDEYGNEGIVASVNLSPDGIANFIIVVSADETETSWGPVDRAVWYVSEYFNKGYIDGHDFGLDMNQLVEESGVGQFPAFEWCQSKNRDGRPVHSGSWILPTYTELKYVFGRGLEPLNAALESIGGTPVSDDGYYWSAVEDIDDAFHFADETLSANFDFDQKRRAIPMTSDCLFSTHKQFWNKAYEYRVRAIKYIYYKRLSPDEIDKLEDED